MNKYIATSCEFRLTEDNWKDGEGETLSVWGEDVEPADTVEGVLKNVNYIDRDFFADNRPLIESACNNGVFENDPVHEGDYSRFDADLMIYIDGDDHILKPTKQMYEDFKKGIVDLYNLHICVYIRKVVDLDEDDLAVESIEQLFSN